MSQDQIKDIIDRVEALTATVVELKTTLWLLIKAMLVAGGAAGSVCMAIFVWWLNKH
jgi:hypothetical protein